MLGRRLTQGLAHVGIDQGEHHHARVLCQVGDNFLQLPARSHQRPDMLDGLDMLELRQRCARDGGDGFTRRIRHQMEVEFLVHIFGLIHRSRRMHEVTQA